MGGLLLLPAEPTSGFVVSALRIQSRAPGFPLLCFGRRRSIVIRRIGGLGVGSSWAALRRRSIVVLREIDDMIGMTSNLAGLLSGAGPSSSFVRSMMGMTSNLTVVYSGVETGLGVTGLSRVPVLRGHAR